MAAKQSFWEVGDRVVCRGYRGVWTVESVEERGLVVSLNGSHKRLLEWNELTKRWEKV